MPVLSPSEQQAAYSALSKLSQRDLATIWAKLSLGKPAKLADTLTEILDALVSRYGQAAASLAADWYEEARAAAGVSGSFAATAAPLPDVDRVGALSRWGVGPLFGAEPNGALALSLLSGGLQRLVTGMGRQTTELSVATDPQVIGYARHASANACAFCRMLATRGDDFRYTSEQSAGFVTGESLGGKDYRKMRRTGVSSADILSGRRSRSSTKRPIGEKYHDDCHCVPVPIWSSSDYEPPAYVEQWRADYAAAREKSGSSKTGDILSAMRELTGAR